MSRGGGFLAIWSDVSNENETDYLHWLAREHTQERVAIPGFLGVRVFRARAPDIRRYFILYDLVEPTVVGSAAYLARLNDPTLWSRRIMPILQNFVRGGGRRLSRIGHGRGAFVAPWVLTAELMDQAVMSAPSISVSDRIAAVQILAVDREASDIRTDEKAIRSGDRSFDGLLLIEALDEPALRSALEAFGLATQGYERAMTYDQIFSLDVEDLV